MTLSQAQSRALLFLYLFLRSGASHRIVSEDTSSANTGCDLVSTWHEEVTEEPPTSSAGCHPQRPSVSP